MPDVRVFTSMLAAVAYITFNESSHAFTVETYDDRNALRADPPEDPAARETYDRFMANDTNCVAAYGVGSEAHYGDILAHYTPDGEIVRFVAFPT